MNGERTPDRKMKKYIETHGDNQSNWSQSTWNGIMHYGAHVNSNTRLVKYHSELQNSLLWFHAVTENVPLIEKISFCMLLGDRTTIAGALRHPLNIILAFDKLSEN